MLTAIAYVGAVLLASPYLVYSLRHYPKAFSRQLPDFSLHLVRMVLPVSDKLFGVTSLIRYSNHLGRVDIDDYLGLPLLLIPFALVLFARSNRVARLLAIGLVFVTALAAGPTLIIGNRELVHLPWGGLWSLPIARSAEPSRLIIFVYLVASIALALWLAAPGQEQAASWPRAGASACWRSRFSSLTCPHRTRRWIPSRSAISRRRRCVRPTSCRRSSPMACTGGTCGRARPS